ncbi:MAG: response regulator transcription factor [Anaerolineae bacterium]|nr:response regulator transcription factor [Anaerolineae bacterium]
MTTILVIDSDERIADRMAKILQAEEMVASVATEGEEALLRLNEEPPDAVVLNLGLPGGWEEDLCREIRERTIAPLLVVGKRGQEFALARGLNAGGDAHLLKPFTTRIFLAQLYALLRRVGFSRPGHAGQFDIGRLVINIFRREVRVDGKPVDLTPTEFEILRCLLNNSGRALTYRSLVRQVQGYDCSSEEARKLLKVHIYNLRKKIEADPEKPAHVLNVRGFGYLFERRTLNRETLNQTLS